MKYYRIVDAVGIVNCSRWPVAGSGAGCCRCPPTTKRTLQRQNLGKRAEGSEARTLQFAESVSSDGFPAGPYRPTHGTSRGQWPVASEPRTQHLHLSQFCRFLPLKFWREKESQSERAGSHLPQDRHELPHRRRYIPLSSIQQPTTSILQGTIPYHT